MIGQAQARDSATVLVMRFGLAHGVALFQSDTAVLVLIKYEAVEIDSDELIYILEEDGVNEINQGELRERLFRRQK